MTVNEVLFDLLDAYILHVKVFDDTSEIIDICWIFNILDYLDTYMFDSYNDGFLLFECVTKLLKDKNEKYTIYVKDILLDSSSDQRTENWPINLEECLVSCRHVVLNFARKDSNTNLKLRMHGKDW